MPYYWNIAPNRDATFTPGVLSRRGASLDAEYRYLEPGLPGRGERRASCCPATASPGAIAGRSTWRAPGRRWQEGLAVGAVDYGAARVERVSDDEFWKDIQRPAAEQDAAPAAGHRPYAQRRFSTATGATRSPTRAWRQWQTLQERRPGEPHRLAPTSARRRSARVSWRRCSRGFEWTWEVEGNRFTKNDDENFDNAACRPAHACMPSARLARPWWPLGFARLDHHAGACR